MVRSGREAGGGRAFGDALGAYYMMCFCCFFFTTSSRSIILSANLPRQVLDEADDAVRADAEDQLELPRS